MRKSVPFVLALAITMAASIQADVTAPPSSGVPELKFNSVVMYRSVCYGPCPIYEVQIFSDGRVTFKGEQHVHSKGVRNARIAASDVAFLGQALARIDFLNLHERYRFVPDGCKSSATDNPTVDIVVTVGKVKKHVSYYYGCGGLEVGPRIDWLSKTIDEVSGSSRWVTFGDERDP